MTTFRQAHKTAKTIGAAMMTFPAAAILIVEFVRSNFRPFTGFGGAGHRTALRYALYVAAAASVILLRVVHGSLLRKRRSEDAPSALSRLVLANLTVLGLAEVPAVLGLALFFLGGFNRDFYVLAFVSLVLMFMYFPRRRTWESYLQGRNSSCPL
ncbi:MAG: hypothetical protein FJY82_07980 [Candidatus Aminicenantes bacterium]|nr:hypothetical protein [Candidatus Aminicenantes bacterium]